jgi:hypothetical protein
VRFLFATLLSEESEFYGRVAAQLVRRGHDAVFVTESGDSGRLLRAEGFQVYVLPDAASALEPHDWGVEAARLSTRYGLPSIRDVYRVDPPCAGKPEAWCIERTVRRFLALEQILDEAAPDVIVPEVGRETIRVASHLAGVDRGIPVLFLFYTIFPHPLRLYVDTMHAPIVPPEAVRPLSADEEAELDAFRREFTARAEPIRAHRTVALDPRRLVSFASIVKRKLGPDRDNDYLHPATLLADEVGGIARGVAARAVYARRRPGRPFVYFPLHVVDDYKIERLIPHCRDQVSLAEQIADALPPGYDLVVKEHPLSIGRNPLSLLRRLGRVPNVRVVHPRESSHELIEASDAVAVISSTVGLEALLYEKPVLTLGQPFYSGYGVTLDVDSFAELREAVPSLLHFRPDRERTRRFLHAAMRACKPGAPVQVDRSQENALALAATLDDVGREFVAARRRGSAGAHAVR